MAVAIRNISKTKTFTKEPSFVKYIPYSQHLTDTIISTVGKEYLIVFRLQGRTHQSAHEDSLRSWVLDLNHVAKQIGNEHVKFWTHLHHHEIESYPEGHYKTRFAREFDAKYRKGFEKTPLMTNDLYLTVVYNPVGDMTQKFLARFDKPTREQLEDRQKQAIETFEDITSQLMGAMGSYGIEPLGLYYRDKNGNVIEDDDDAGDADELDDDLEGDLLADLPEDDAAEAAALAVPAAQRHVFSHALEWFGFLANGEWSPVPVCRGRINDYLMTNRPVSSPFGDVMQIRTIDRNIFMSAVEIRKYEEETEPGQLNLLMEAPFEFVLTQVFSACRKRPAASFCVTSNCR